MSSQVLTGQGSAALDVWVRLLRGHAIARRAVSVELQGEHGLTINDYEALLLLHRAEDHSMRRVDLAEGLSLTASGVTRLLEGLEQQDLVERATCESDARVTYARLTEAGRRKLVEASEPHLAAVRGLFEERYSEEELVRLAELLARLPGPPVGDASECTP